MPKSFLAGRKYGKDRRCSGIEKNEEQKDEDGM